MKIYSGKFQSEEDFYYVVNRDCVYHQVCYATIGSSSHVPASNLTDLTELEFHAKGSGVWIEGVTAEELRTFAEKVVVDPFAIYYTNKKCGRNSNEIRMQILVALHAQLPAKMDEPKPSAKVQIELTKDRLDWFRSIAKFLYEQERPGWGDFIKEVIGEYASPMEEPKVGEAIVAYWRLGEGGEDSIDEFMRFTDSSEIEDQYISINHGDRAKWVDLLNPERISK